MNLTIQRLQQTTRSTTGKLLIEGVPAFATLESPKVPDPDGNGTVCISAGTYPLTIRWSAEHNRQLPHVENVPGRTGIEWHVGNFPTDVKGCAAIGKDFGTLSDYVSHSSIAFASLMTILYRGSVLTNPDAAEPAQVWQVGTVQYLDPIQGVSQ